MRPERNKLNHKEKRKAKTKFSSVKKKRVFNFTSTMNHESTSNSKSKEKEPRNEERLDLAARLVCQMSEDELNEHAEFVGATISLFQSKTEKPIDFKKLLRYVMEAYERRDLNFSEDCSSINEEMANKKKTKKNREKQAKKEKTEQDGVSMDIFCESIVDSMISVGSPLPESVLLKLAEEQWFDIPNGLEADYREAMKSKYFTAKGFTDGIYDIPSYKYYRSDGPLIQDLYQKTELRDSFLESRDRFLKVFPPNRSVDGDGIMIYDWLFYEKMGQHTYIVSMTMDTDDNGDEKQKFEIYTSYMADAEVFAEWLFWNIAYKNAAMDFQESVKQEQEEIRKEQEEKEKEKKAEEEALDEKLGEKFANAVANHAKKTGSPLPRKTLLRLAREQWPLIPLTSKRKSSSLPKTTVTGLLDPPIYNHICNEFFQQVGPLIRSDYYGMETYVTLKIDRALIYKVFIPNSQRNSIVDWGFFSRSGIKAQFIVTMSPDITKDNEKKFEVRVRPGDFKPEEMMVEIERFVEWFYWQVAYKNVLKDFELAETMKEAAQITEKEDAQLKGIKKESANKKKKEGEKKIAKKEGPYSQIDDHTLPEIAAYSYTKCSYAELVVLFGKPNRSDEDEPGWSLIRKDGQRIYIIVSDEDSLLYIDGLFDQKIISARVDVVSEFKKWINQMISDSIESLNIPRVQKELEKPKYTKENAYLFGFPLTSVTMSVTREKLTSLLGKPERNDVGHAEWIVGNENRDTVKIAELDCHLTCFNVFGGDSQIQEFIAWVQENSNLDWHLENSPRMMSMSEATAAADFNALYPSFVQGDYSQLENAATEMNETEEKKPLTFKRVPASEGMESVAANKLERCYISREKMTSYFREPDIRNNNIVEWIVSLADSNTYEDRVLIYFAYDLSSASSYSNICGHSKIRKMFLTWFKEQPEAKTAETKEIKTSYQRLPYKKKALTSNQAADSITSTYDKIEELFGNPDRQMANLLEWVINRTDDTDFTHVLTISIRRDAERRLGAHDGFILSGTIGEIKRFKKWFYGINEV